MLDYVKQFRKATALIIFASIYLLYKLYWQWVELHTLDKIIRDYTYKSCFGYYLLCILLFSVENGDLKTYLPRLQYLTAYYGSKCFLVISFLCQFKV